MSRVSVKHRKTTFYSVSFISGLALAKRSVHTQQDTKDQRASLGGKAALSCYQGELVVESGSENIYPTTSRLLSFHLLYCFRKAFYGLKWIYEKKSDTFGKCSDNFFVSLLIPRGEISVLIKQN